MPNSAPANNDNFVSYQVEMRTTDATEVALVSIPTYLNGVYQIKAYINAKAPVLMNCGGWEITGTFKNVDGVVSLIGALDFISNADSTLDATVSFDATFIQPQVTGIAGTLVVWTGNIQVSRLQLAY